MPSARTPSIVCAPSDSSFEFELGATIVVVLNPATAKPADSPGPENVATRFAGRADTILPVTLIGPIIPAPAGSVLTSGAGIFSTVLF